MIRNPEKSPFWGAFGLPTIWVCVRECLSLRVFHYNRHPHLFIHFLVIILMNNSNKNIMIAIIVMNTKKIQRLRKLQYSWDIHLTF